MPAAQKPYIADYALPSHELAHQADDIYRLLEENKDPVAAMEKLRAAIGSCRRLQVVIQQMIEEKQGAKP